MTDADLYRLWVLWLVVGGALVVVAAALLIAIAVVARGIEWEAGRALRAAERIRESTRPIWALDDTNRVADDLLAAARDIETHASEIARSLGGSGAAEEART